MGSSARLSDVTRYSRTEKLKCTSSSFLRALRLPYAGTDVGIHSFSTAVDDQHTVTIQVYEGERAQTKHNHLLGRFELTGIQPAPKGVPQIEVTFELDDVSNMNISALDRGTLVIFSSFSPWP